MKHTATKAETILDSVFTPLDRSKAWLACSLKLKAMSDEHKAIHEKTTDQWERAYHLGAAVALQDARLEVMSFGVKENQP